MQEFALLIFPGFPFQAYVVKSNPWFEFYFPLFQTRCPTLAHPKPMENKIWTKDQIELQQILYFLLLAPSPPPPPPRPPLFKTGGGGGGR